VTFAEACDILKYLVKYCFTKVAVLQCLREDYHFFSSYPVQHQIKLISL